MHSVLRMKKKFSAMALSCGFPRLDMEGVMPYHDPQHSFGISGNALAFQPQPHPTVAIGIKTVFQLLGNHLPKRGIFSRPAETMDKGIVAAPGYSKEFTHDCHGILCIASIPGSSI